MLQLHQFWKFFRGKLSYKKPHIITIETIRLRSLEPQNNDVKTKKILSKNLPKNWEDTEGEL